MITDRLAISLSLLCAVHCLLLPIAIVMLPSLAALGLHDEVFHIWMLVAVIPTSIYALTKGCRQHQRYQLLALGGLGLSLMIFAVLGESVVGEVGEKGLTLTGALLLAFGHYRNFRLCQQAHNCPCPEQGETM